VPPVQSDAASARLAPAVIAIETRAAHAARHATRWKQFIVVPIPFVSALTERS
jgi:hypothetical protein